MITKVSQVQSLVKKAIVNPNSTFAEIKKMAENDDWKLREVAATVLVETSKKKPDDLLQEMKRWAVSKNPNVRRTSSEGLRGIARNNPEKVAPIIEMLRTDSNLYVKKSVANILRNASKKNPKFVLNLCNKWLKLKNPNTNWIIKDGLRKLKISCPKEANKLLKSITK